jgi:hypothetical protein
MELHFVTSTSSSPAWIAKRRELVGGADRGIEVGGSEKMW